MKILFLTRGFPSDKDPMAGNYESVQAKAIAAKGHEVSVIAIKWQNILHAFKSKKILHRVVDGIQVYECNGLTASIPHIYFPRIEHVFREHQFKRVFKKYIDEQGMPDIVHAHIITMASPAIYLKKEYNLPFVITEHWTVMNAVSTPRRIMNQAIVYNYADQVICVSKALADSLKKKCNVPSIVISNMVSDLFFQSQKIKRNDGIFKFIAVGAMRENKGFDILIDAFFQANLPDNVKLDIIGDGEKRDTLEGKITKYALNEQVQLLGVKTPTEVSDLLCRSDCFVLSSRLETFAIVVIEAMAKGLPVIATRCGGPESFVRPEDGILVEKENVEDLAKAMKYMLDCYQEYDADNIRQNCYNNFSQSVIADKIVDMYYGVLNK